MQIKWWHIVLFALIIIGIAVALHPSKLRTGWMYLESSEIDKALSEFHKAYYKNPKNPRAVAYLAAALEATGQMNEAERLFEELLDIKPNDKNFKDAIRFYGWTEQPQKTLRTYERWYAYRADDGGSLDDDGRTIMDNLYAFYLLYQEYDKALDILKARREIEPSRRSDTDIDLITLYEITDDMESTVAILESILDSNSQNAYALDKFMDLAVMSGKVNKVENYLINNINKNPKDDAAWDRLIRYETNLKRYDVADTWYKKRIDRKGGGLDIKKRYVEFLLATSQQKEAIGYLEDIIDNKPSDPYYKTTLVELYEWNDMKQNLIGPYLEKFQKDPYDRRNSDNLLSILMDLKRYDEARKILIQLNDIYPGDRAYSQMLADLYSLEDDSGRAISTLERAVKRGDDPILLKRLGELYLWNSDKPVVGSR